MRMARRASNRIQKLEASAGFEPAVEVLQIAICSSPEFAEAHCVLNSDDYRSLWFIACRQSSAALPSPLPSNLPAAEAAPINGTDHLASRVAHGVVEIDLSVRVRHGKVLAASGYLATFGCMPIPAVWQRPAGALAILIGVLSVIFSAKFSAASRGRTSRPVAVFVGAVFILFGSLTVFGIIHLAEHCPSSS